MSWTLNLLLSLPKLNSNQAQRQMRTELESKRGPLPMGTCTSPSFRERVCGQKQTGSNLCSLPEWEKIIEYALTWAQRASPTDSLTPHKDPKERG